MPTEYKLTMVSVYARGKRRVIFVRLPIYNGKAVAPWSLINSLIPEISRGETFSIG